MCRITMRTPGGHASVSMLELTCGAAFLQGGQSETKASSGRSRHKARSLAALRNRMVQQVQLLFNELDRHGGAERLVASASRGAGSADNGECDDFPPGAETLSETSLREMSLDEVCEALAAKGLEMYVGLFQRESLDGAKLCEMDEPSILAMGVDRYVVHAPSAALCRIFPFAIGFASDRGGGVCRALCSSIMRGHV